MAGAGGLEALMARHRFKKINLNRLRAGLLPRRFLRFNCRMLVLLCGGAVPAQSQTVLERVLERIQVSGLFVNAAQSGLGATPARIDAGITTLANPGRLAGLAGASSIRQAQSVAIGTLESVALGATNAGDVILSVAVSAAVSSTPAEMGSLRGISPASVLLLGENTAYDARVDLAQVDELIAFSRMASFESLQPGTTPEAMLAVMNLAASGGDVSARILTHVEGVVLETRNATTTALGAVNVGLARVTGDR